MKISNLFFGCIFICVFSHSIASVNNLLEVENYNMKEKKMLNLENGIKKLELELLNKNEEIKKLQDFINSKKLIAYNKICVQNQTGVSESNAKIRSITNKGEMDANEQLRLQRNNSKKSNNQYAQ